MPQFCVRYTKNAKIYFTPDAKPKICVSPNTKPQRQSVECRLRWVQNANFSCSACTFHIFCRFNLLWVANFQWNMGQFTTHFKIMLYSLTKHQDQDSYTVAGLALKKENAFVRYSNKSFWKFYIIKSYIFGKKEDHSPVLMK